MTRSQQEKKRGAAHFLGRFWLGIPSQKTGFPDYWRPAENAKEKLFHTSAFKRRTKLQRNNCKNLTKKVMCVFSFKEDTVREQMKRTDPRKPPRMVSHSDDPSCLLNICMPAKTSTDRRLDSTREVPVLTAAKQRGRGRQGGGEGDRERFLTMTTLEVVDMLGVWVHSANNSDIWW